MKILYVGAEAANWVVNLCNEFGKLGHQVTCLCCSDDEYDKENPIEINKNVKKIGMNFYDLINPIKLKTKIMTELRETKPDIIFGSHAPVSTAISELAKMYRIPWGVMLLDIPSDLMSVQRERMKQWLFWFDNLKYADVMIFNTNIARDEYLRYTGQLFNDDHVIPYAINMNKEYKNAGVNIKGDYVLSIFRLTPVKNGILIPVALSILDLPLKYIAIGRDSGQLQDIQAFCKINNIEFEYKGTVSEKEKFELIKNSSMLIYPQITEYIGGLSPLEAMYIGKPALVTDYKVLSDLYRENAFYFKPSPDALAKEISFIHSTKREIMSSLLTNSSDYVEKEFSFETMARKMVKTFDRVVRQ